MTDTLTPSQSTSLYRLFDNSGALLYVGVTSGGMSHKSKHWWPEVATTKWASYPDRTSAEEAETAAIETEGPKYNKMGRPTEGVKIQVRIPADVLKVLDLEADIHLLSRARLVRAILWEWVENGYGRSAP